MAHATVRRFSSIILGALLSAASIASQQPTTPGTVVESAQDLVSRLTPEQKQHFDNAMQAFNAQRYSEAFTWFKDLLTQIPDDPFASKLAAESALNAGEKSFALRTLKPIADKAPDDWQAAALLTRACAEAGDTNCRDGGMAHMVDLHRRGLMPAGMQAYLLERIPAGENTLTIRASVQPWGHYNVYDLGQLSNKEGQIFLRITLESGDADQPQFAREHPKEAAQGIRGFSLDAYRNMGPNSSGQQTQTHSTYKFFVGQPSYETVRADFIAVATGKMRPISSRDNLVQPR